MEEAFVKRLLNVDRELHLLIEELSSEKQEEQEELSLEELRELFRKDNISDEDPTGLIRQMRDKEY